MKKIAIIGAGISGLFVANLFKENPDYQVTIYEINKSINLDEGYGIQLSRNSINLLNGIGFSTLDNNDKFNPEKIDFYEIKKEKKICDLNISDFNSEDCKYTTLKRSKLVEFLYSYDNVIDVDSLIRLGVVDYAVIAFALAIFSWFGMARLVRGQVLQIRESQYIDAAVAAGASTPRILFVHVLPNTLAPIIVSISTSLAGIAGAEIVLSWIGIGIQPPTPSLGVMIFENGNISVLRTNPHMILFPVGIVGLLLFTFNLVGDAVVDAFNPRARRG